MLKYPTFHHRPLQQARSILIDAYGYVKTLRLC
jgi:hypothetical protein